MTQHLCLRVSSSRARPFSTPRRVVSSFLPAASNGSFGTLSSSAASSRSRASCPRGLPRKNAGVDRAFSSLAALSTSSSEDPSHSSDSSGEVEGGEHREAQFRELDDLLDEAHEHFSHRRFQECLRVNDKVMDRCKRTIGEHNLEDRWDRLCAAQVNSAFVLKLLCDWEPAAALLREAITALGKNYVSYKRETAQAHELLAEILLNHEQSVGSRSSKTTTTSTDEAVGDEKEKTRKKLLVEAQTAIERALSSKRDYLGEDESSNEHSARATPLHLHGRYFERTGDLEQAKLVYLRAFANAYQQGEVPPPPACGSLSNYASCLQDQGSYERAIGVYERVAQFLKENAGTETNLHVGQAYADLGVAAMGAGMREGALQALQKALVIHASILGMDHQGVQNVMALVMQVNSAEFRETKTDLDTKQELIERGHAFVDDLVEQKKRENERKRVRLTSDVSEETRFFDHAGYVGHGPRGYTVRLRADRSFLANEATDPYQR
ncbi:unnamed protein product [Amoebophrya sp. A25]|nr:unnamed protein product [Amoebophrya sp. A25]|eukprot:GSA25T00011686001.1